MRFAFSLWAGVLTLGAAVPGAAAPADPGRLFFTPEQRAMLEAARARHLAQPGTVKQATGGGAEAPLRYDGVLIRSDGKTTRWVDGKPHLDSSAVSGMKPGQIRSEGKVYEPYQVLLPRASNPGVTKESTP